MSSFEKYLGAGWYPLEFSGKQPFVWSKKEAYLNFAKNKNGFVLVVSAALTNLNGQPVEVVLYDFQNNLIKTELLDEVFKTLEIPKGLKKIKIVVSQTNRPNLRDKRELGLCLYRVEEGKFSQKASLKPQLLQEECPWLPQVLEIETTSICNINPPCVMCPRVLRYPRAEKSMSESLLNKLKPYLKEAQMVSLHGSGEPLADGRVFDFLEIIDPKKTITKFNTNGLLLNEEIAEKIIEKQVKEVNFSLDAARAETYRKIRGRDFFKVKENIKMLAKLKKEMKSRYPAIKINMILMKENFQEMPDFVDLAAEVGAEAVDFRLLNRTNVIGSLQKRGDFYFNYAEQFVDLNDEKFKEVFATAFKKGAEGGIKFDSSDQELWDAARKQNLL